MPNIVKIKSKNGEFCVQENDCIRISTEKGNVKGTIMMICGDYDENTVFIIVIPNEDGTKDELIDIKYSETKERVIGKY